MLTYSSVIDVIFSNKENVCTGSFLRVFLCGHHPYSNWIWFIFPKIYWFNRYLHFVVKQQGKVAWGGLFGDVMFFLFHHHHRVACLLSLSAIIISSLLMGIYFLQTLIRTRVHPIIHPTMITKQACSSSLNFKRNFFPFFIHVLLKCIEIHEQIRVELFVVLCGGRVRIL